MKSKIDFDGYNTLLQPTEWRYAAATTGLVEYFKFNHISYGVLSELEEKPKESVFGFDGILYNQEDITEERYLDFAEDHFKDDMTHIRILQMLEKDEFTEEQIKAVNDMVKSKTVLKKLFGKTKFDGTNKQTVADIINNNRHEIIKSVFRYGKNLYSNYANSNLLLTASNPHCRLAGYTLDEGRKTRFLGFCFAKESYETNDIPEFDFIPFAFSNSDMYETFFVNNNFSVKDLVQTNKRVSEALNSVDKRDSRLKLLTVLQQAKDYINYNIEIIMKSRDNDYYSTLYVRVDRLKQLRNLSDKSLNYLYMIANNDWLDVEREVYERCINNVFLDDIILQMLKIYFDKDVNKMVVKLRTDTLIDINEAWKGNKVMDEIMNARHCGKKVSKKLIEDNKKNKISSFKQKIVSALVAHDYDSIKNLISRLSEETSLEFWFFYKLLDSNGENNAEKYKDIIYAFTNAITENVADKGDSKIEENDSKKEN